jgi:hypothetical protein
MTMHDIIGYGGFSLVAGALLTLMHHLVKHENPKGVS